MLNSIKLRLIEKKFSALIASLFQDKEHLSKGHSSSFANEIKWKKNFQTNEA